MPKQVDHQERRRRIAEAVWRVTAGRGLEAVSLRHVAAEAGVSMGMVQHYFRTKDEMLLFALESMEEGFSARIGESLRTATDPEAPRSLLRALLVQMLPLDEQRRTEARVGLTFTARATVQPRLAAFLREGHSSLHDFVAGQLHHAQARGEVPAGVDPEQEATTLLALVDGLAAHALFGARTPEATLAALDSHLSRVFPGA